MDFFQQQDHARRQTKTLVFLFVLAVIAIVLAVNAVAAFLWHWAQGGNAFGTPTYPRGFFFTNSAITIALIAVGTMIEIFNLRDGGDAVAQMAGGRLVLPATRDLQERRLVNVVEEMALASGISCPRVYVLDKEDSINAFAAGYNQNEAVVAVTRGTLARLTRDELQGVIGHEFSHILNGDMRLNVRLIGVLFGIQMVNVFGQHLLDFASRMGGSRSRDDKGPSLQAIMFVLGIALVVIGWIGVFFGRLIKAAVSRQREFLADASSVQFTRNPDGIGNALRKIGGLSKRSDSTARIHHPNAEQLSHLFLNSIKPSLLSGLYATHPPIPERLRRIYGRNVELMDAPELPGKFDSPEPVLPDIPYVASGFAGGPVAASDEAAAPSIVTGAVLPALGTEFGHGIVQQVRLSEELDGALRDPQAACAVVYALLFERGAEPNPQVGILQAEVPQQVAFVSFLAETIGKLPKGARLPVLDLAMPALKQLPQPERDRMLAITDKLIAADNRISLPEFVLQTVLARRLDARAGRAVPVKFTSLAALKQECTLLLSLVAHVATRESRQQDKDAPFQAFLRGAADMAELGLVIGDMCGAADIGFVRVREALDRANQLAPLAKPGLIKALVATAGADNATLGIDVADVLRAISAALDAPMPPAVAEAYAHCEPKA